MWGSVAALGAALGAALEQAGRPAVNEVFPGPHGYSTADTAMYDEESTERHFASLRTLLDATLRPVPDAAS
jgi:carboxymethylenebutenolidase